ncbi:uncharacterized protein PHACADRAFT_206987 [Phanerochaete carnosa HHB-10118-sp]|uniref:Uncharacterized protein n=1 Tax=Phanerochaete carnosa (strain HHB-10118-sp) TaxID=650164 RepID=K5WGC5_PHACS|nr:uncharacterized protein PHACADRAFT_206987 [Phanerochaete carnosa HHB-10118-sp]EKM58154.1 hypothetical protein PHACADRAFT_206987 [Phanerochaete carnosa HHB-10118-sp]
MPTLLADQAPLSLYGVHSDHWKYPRLSLAGVHNSLPVRLSTLALPNISRRRRLAILFCQAWFVMALTMAKADFIGTLLETLCYGIYFMLFAGFLRVLYAKHQAGRLIWRLLLIALIIFFLITAHLALQINRMLEAFADHRDVPNAPLMYFRTLSRRESGTKASIYTTLTLICDALIVYRVFVVYERKWFATVIPSMLFLADMALAAWYIWGVSRIDGVWIWMPPILPISFFYAVTLALNLLCTVMISWKISFIHRKLLGSAVAGIRIESVIVIIIESAAIYSCILIALIVTSVTNTIGLWIALNPICPIIGMIRVTYRPRAER